MNYRTEREQNHEKSLAIEIADAHTNNVGLPTYSELLKALRDVEKNCGMANTEQIIARIALNVLNRVV